MAKKKGTPASPFVPEEEQPYPIPENWRWVKFSSVIELISGRDAALTDCNSEGIGIPYILGASNIENNTFTIERWIETPQVISNKGDILLSVKGTIGKLYIQQEEKVNISRQIMAIRPTEILNRKFAYLFLLLVCDELREAGNGLIPGISRADILDKAFPFMPLPEQHRIVTRIESLFAKLDEAKEKARAVVDGFELRKSAIMHKAFTGELTEQWRKEHGAGLESWAKVELIDVLTEKPRNGYSPKPVNYVTPYKSMTLSATTSGVFKDEYFKYIDETIPEDSYLWLKPGDILIQRANSLDKVGTSAIYTGREHEFIYPDLMMKLQVKKTVSPRFIAYSLKKDDILEYFRANATGTAGNMPKINQKTVSNTPIDLPTFDEQIEIVRILESLFGKAQQAKEAAEAVLAQIDAMKKAILARAFRGELGTNDPEEESMGELLRAIL